MLSFAGRLTLTKAVLPSIPVHSISSIVLPQSTLIWLDRVSRSFLWGSTMEKKKQHLEAWKRVCLPKKAGGLGIRVAAYMNKALIAKVGKIHDPRWLVAKAWSSTMRSIGIKLREVVMRRISWVIGDGRKIRFWTDRWVSGKRLLDVEADNIPDNYEAMLARELWHDGMGWDLSRIISYISENTRLELASIVLDKVTGAHDRVSWGESQDGNFTVSSAYNMMTVKDGPGQNMACFFDRIWKLKVPERGVETIMHIIRDCPTMVGIWTRLVPRRRQSVFFTKSLLEWIYVNLSEETQVEEGPWSVMFALAVWWGWKWRCGNVLGRIRDVGIDDSWEEAESGEIVRMGGTDGGLAKINTYGASHGNLGFATAEGVLWHSDGKWCGGFALNIGRCSAPLAELWGVYYGLYLAWAARASQVELEVDSAIVVEFLKTGIGKHHPLSFLVHLCHGFISKDYEVRISHVYRKANCLADGLANYDFRYRLVFICSIMFRVV
ncbi:Ribonuclease H domain [Arabidopsis suecica]|uniref:Ribonuclease H domain n=1 Tax=Arabidopsis suecica TaxID=45249 RepID=A0A8T1YPY2_ARASU|nr:Ribonuclease H domain [Arabidopsis suecica]